MTFEWHLRDRILVPGRPVLVMGIVNVTPDSFSDGGQYFDPGRAVEHGLKLVEQGADILDIGGESTRPGSLPVPRDEELRRVVAVVRDLARQSPVCLSIDTTKAEVARQVLEAGAHIINDISALQFDDQLGSVVREYQAGLILMHMQGTPQTMQINPTYKDVVTEVVGFLQARLQAARELGIAENRVVLDPGIGFGKTPLHNLQLLANLVKLRHLGRPVCLGVSRKGFFGHILGRSLSERLTASLAAACHAIVTGGTQILRVHDVVETCDAVRLLDAIALETHP